jgi:hypothetical protein
MQARWPHIKILTLILLLMVLCISTLRAVASQDSSSISLQSTGSIDYSMATGENLIVNPDFSQGETGWDFHPYVSPPFIFLDNSVTHNGHASARLDPTAYIDRSIWPSQRIAVTPGQLVVVKCWVMVGPDDHGGIWGGARLGIDGWDGLYSGTNLEDSGHCAVSSYDLWNNPGVWVQLTLNYTVLPGDASVMPWVQGFWHDCNESVWVTDFELYVY